MMEHAAPSACETSPRRDETAGVETVPTPALAISLRTGRTPYSPRVEAQGVRSYTVYNHTLLPAVFRSLEEDYRHLKRHVQIWDVSCEQQVEVRGAEAARLVQLMTPRDLSKATIGQCIYAPLVDEAGGMINDPVILKLTEDRFWISISDSDVLLWAKGLAVGLGLNVAVDQPDIWPLAVQGPKSDDLLAAVFGEDVRAIRFFRFATVTFRGQPLVVARSGFSKQGGFEIFVDDPVIGLELWDALWDAGQPFDVRAGCPNLIERVEGGLLSYGNDMTRANNPLECGLDRYCALDAPIEFIGREALRRIRAEGVGRRIRGLRIQGAPLPLCQERWPVRAGGLEIGQVTSVANSPDLACGIGLAMLDRGHWRPGEPVEVATPDGTRSAKVTELPFTLDGH
jgi:dimethylsulfoniopropionate demethylase